MCRRCDIQVWTPPTPCGLALSCFFDRYYHFFGKPVKRTQILCSSLSLFLFPLFLFFFSIFIIALGLASKFADTYSSPWYADRPLQHRSDTQIENLRRASIFFFWPPLSPHLSHQEQTVRIAVRSKLSWEGISNNRRGSLHLTWGAAQSGMCVVTLFYFSYSSRILNRLFTICSPQESSFALRLLAILRGMVLQCSSLGCSSFIQQIPTHDFVPSAPLPLPWFSQERVLNFHLANHYATLH